MDKSKNNKISPRKKSLIIIGLVIILPIIAIYISRPILDQIDHNRFIQLDKQVEIIYDKITAIADESDNWKYTKECSGEFTGWLWARKDGRFICKAIISMDKSVTTADEVAALQAKYFPIVDKSENLKESTGLSILPSNFGVDFVIGAAEKHYIETSTNIECWYLAELNQSNETADNVVFGSEIKDGVGNYTISLKCSDESRSYWYEPDEDLQKRLIWVYGPDFE
jgi:hypothetical protein